MRWADTMPSSSAPLVTDATRAGTAVASSHMGVFLASTRRRLKRVRNFTPIAAAAAPAMAGLGGFWDKARASDERSGRGFRRVEALVTTRRASDRPACSSVSPILAAENVPAFATASSAARTTPDTSSVTDEPSPAVVAGTSTLAAPVAAATSNGGTADGLSLRAATAPVYPVTVGKTQVDRQVRPGRQSASTGAS